MAQPIKQFRSGQVQVAIWENTNKDNQTFQSVTLKKMYKDNQDRWQESKSLSTQDLPKAIACLQKAFDHLAVKES